MYAYCIFIGDESSRNLDLSMADDAAAPGSVPSDRPSSSHSRHTTSSSSPGPTNAGNILATMPSSTRRSSAESRSSAASVMRLRAALAALKTASPSAVRKSARARLSEPAEISRRTSPSATSWSTRRTDAECDSAMMRRSRSIDRPGSTPTCISAATALGPRPVSAANACSILSTMARLIAPTMFSRRSSSGRRFMSDSANSMHSA